MLVGVSFSKMLPEAFMLTKCTSKFTKKHVGGDFERGKKKVLKLSNVLIQKNSPL
jgi:hypothetical protein